MKKIISLLLIMVLFLAACHNEPSTKSKNITFKDDTGKTIAFEQHPQHPVSLMHIGIPDALLAAGVQPAGAASAKTVLNQWPAYQRSNKKAVDIGSAQEPDIEQIAELEPDVIIGAKGVHDRYRKELEKIAPVILLDIDNAKMSGIPMVKRLAELFDTEKAAKQTIADYHKKTKEYKNKIKTLVPSNKTVLFVDYYQKEFLLFPKEIMAVNPQGLALKLPDKFPEKSDLPLDSEGILEMNPDYIFFISPTEKDYKSAIESLNSDAAWKAVKAVRSNQVHYLDISAYAYNGLLTNQYGMQQTVKVLEKKQ